MRRNQPEYIIEGYNIYQLVEGEMGDKGDIEPVGNNPYEYLFSTALNICEVHNQRRMIK